MIGTSLLNMAQQISVQSQFKNMVFLRESVLYILQHEAEYVYKSETELKLRKSLLDCLNKGVKADAELAWYNTTELFLEEDA